MIDAILSQDAQPIAYIVGIVIPALILGCIGGRK